MIGMGVAVRDVRDRRGLQGRPRQGGGPLPGQPGAPGSVRGDSGQCPARAWARSDRRAPRRLSGEAPRLVQHRGSRDAGSAPRSAPRGVCLPGTARRPGRRPARRSARPAVPCRTRTGQIAIAATGQSRRRRRCPAACRRGTHPVDPARQVSLPTRQASRRGKPAKNGLEDERSHQCQGAAGAAPASGRPSLSRSRASHRGPPNRTSAFGTRQLRSCRRRTALRSCWLGALSRSWPAGEHQANSASLRTARVCRIAAAGSPGRATVTQTAQRPGVRTRRWDRRGVRGLSGAETSARHGVSDGGR